MGMIWEMAIMKNEAQVCTEGEQMGGSVRVPQLGMPQGRQRATPSKEECSCGRRPLDLWTSAAISGGTHPATCREGGDQQGEGCPETRVPHPLLERLRDARYGP